MSAPRPQPVPRPLAEVLRQSDATVLFVLGAGGASADAAAVDLLPAVTGVALNSADVRPGDLFAAVPGAHTHGANFAHQALAAGAVAVLTDEAGAELCADLAVPIAVVKDPRAVLGPVAAVVYGSPAHRVRTVGVTGTNGKTTVTFLVEAAAQSLGLTTGLIGTTGIHVGSDVLPSARTTPEATDLHAILRLMVERGVDLVALEVSSHSLVLGRVDGLVVDVACFTNLSPDHLDFHGDMESYFAAKADLFTPRRAKSAVICIDDDWGRRLAQQCPLPTTTYGVDPDADWQVLSTSAAVGESSNADVQVVQVRTPDGLRCYRVGLPGHFNVLNAVAAAACLQRMGIDVPESAFECAAVPGRMELVDAGQPFRVVVDYAHSPDAVVRVLDALRVQTDGRIICVLGCGGDRDRDKRPVMGECAALRCDLLVVTDDNPRSEDPAAIRAAMLAGIPAERRTHVVEIGDRALAIRHAVQAARPGDTVAILGKGHEPGQEIAGRILAFDDREQARSAIAEVAA